MAPVASASWLAPLPGVGRAARLRPNEAPRRRDKGRHSERSHARPDAGRRRHGGRVPGCRCGAPRRGAPGAKGRRPRDPADGRGHGRRRQGRAIGHRAPANDAGRTAPRRDRCGCRRARDGCVRTLARCCASGGRVTGRCAVGAAPGHRPARLRDARRAAGRTVGQRAARRSPRRGRRSAIDQLVRCGRNAVGAAIIRAGGTGESVLAIDSRRIESRSRVWRRPRGRGCPRYERCRVRSRAPCGR